MNPAQRLGGVILHPTSLPGPHGSGDFGPDAFHFVDWLATAALDGVAGAAADTAGLRRLAVAAVSAFAGFAAARGARAVGGVAGLRRRTRRNCRHSAPSVCGSTRSCRGAWRSCARRLRASWRARTRTSARRSRRSAANMPHGSTTTRSSWRSTGTSARAVSVLDEVGPRPRAPRTQPRWPPRARRTPTSSASGASSSGVFARSGTRAQGLRQRQGRADRRRPADLRRAATAPTAGRGPICSSSTRRSSPPSSPACRPTISRRPASAGATRCTTGRAMQRDGFAWWIARMRNELARADLVRIDHFRGFAAYWEIPATSRPRSRAAGLPAPGEALFEALARALGDAAAHRRGPRHDHARRRGAARPLRLARHEGAAVRVRRRRHPRLPAAQLPAELLRLHRHARQRHDASAGGAPQRHASGVLPRFTWTATPTTSTGR